MSDELVESGVTVFAAPRSPTYRYVVSSKAGKISISLEDQKTKQQWRTGYLAEDAYLTHMNRIGNAAVGDYVSMFKEALDYLVGTGSEPGNTKLDTSKTRRELVSVDGGLQLELSSKIKFGQSAWSAKFVFKLAPVSLERIDVLESRLRDAENELETTKTRLEEMGKAERVYLYAKSDELNRAGKSEWGLIEGDVFELTRDRTAIRFLVPGLYAASLNVDLTPRVGGATIEQRRNDEQLECSVVSFNGDERTSASIGFIAPFDKNDKYSVVAVDDYLREIQADITIAKIGS